MKKVERHRIVLVRVGENRAEMRGQFAGWLDCPLTERGQKQAIVAGKALKFSGLHFQSAHSSLLTRAGATLDIILGLLKQSRIILGKSWRLNERQFGALTGMKIFDAVARYGPEKVNYWRFSSDGMPPEMDETHRYFPSIIGDSRYKEDPGIYDIPTTESLNTLWSRVLPYWDEEIVPLLKARKTVLIVTDGDVIRALVKSLECIDEEKIVKVNCLPGIPMIYDLDADLKPLKPAYFLTFH